MEDKDFECFPYASSNVVGPFLREAKVLNASLTLACPSIIASTFFPKIWKISSEHCLKIPDLMLKVKSCWWWRNVIRINLQKESIPYRRPRILKHLQTILQPTSDPAPHWVGLSWLWSWELCLCSFLAAKQALLTAVVGALYDDTDWTRGRTGHCRLYHHLCLL